MKQKKRRKDDETNVKIRNDSKNQVYLIKELLKSLLLLRRSHSACSLKGVENKDAHLKKLKYQSRPTSLLPIMKRATQLLTLVPNDVKGVAKLLGDGGSVAALAEQRVDGLLVVPVLLGGHFGQVGGTARLSALVLEFDADAVRADLPVAPRVYGLKVGEKRDAAVELGELLLADRVETRVSDGAGERVLAQAVVQIEGLEGADAAAQTLLASDVPGDKEWKLVVRKGRRMTRLLGAVEMRVEHVEAIIDHVVAYGAFRGRGAGMRRQLLCFSRRVHKVLQRVGIAGR